MRPIYLAIGIHDLLHEQPHAAAFLQFHRVRGFQRLIELLHHALLIQRHLFQLRRHLVLWNDIVSPAAHRRLRFGCNS